MLATGALAGPIRAQEDTLQATSRVDELLRRYYGTRSGFSNPRSSGGSFDRYCDAGSGALCHGGDPDRGYCRPNVTCHTTPEFLVEGLLETSSLHPSSGYALGQTVYALAKFGYLNEASEIVEGCRAAAWWCSALRGYLLHTLGIWNTAEENFREALDAAPPSFTCSQGDASWLLGEWDQRKGEVDLLPPFRNEAVSLSCEQRLRVSERVLWLSDPLLGVEGNERWTEHQARAMSARFSAEIRRAVRGAEVPDRYLEHDWAMQIRRGTWDSFEIPLGGNSVRFWTSLESARFRFVPEIGLDEGSVPEWKLEGSVLEEGFTPDVGPFLPLSVQVARFRSGDSLLVAAAADLMGSPLDRAVEATALLTLAAGPDDAPVRHRDQVRRSNPKFIGSAPSRGHVAGFEVLTEIGIGWDRRWISPLGMVGPELSDLLLFDPSDMEEPATLQDAATVMLASPEVEREDRVGVFWETYGVPEGVVLSFELTLSREPGRLVDRLRTLLSSGLQEGRGSVSWTEPALAGIQARSLILDLGDLGSGSYELVLEASWPGQPPIRRTRTLLLR